MNRIVSGFLLFLAFLLVTAASYFGYLHRTQIAELATFAPAPCTKTIDYTVGPIDPRFSITKDEVVKNLKQAADLWNEAAGKTLLAYNPSDPSAMPVNFVYDARQQTVSLGQKIDSTEASQNAERTQIETLQQQYIAAQQSYANAVAAFNTESEAYAAEVARVNASGGADPATYARLTDEKTQLKEKQQALETQGTALNQEADALKARIDTYNASVRSINQVVNSFNSEVGGDFEEGQFVRDSSGAEHIDIYAYKNQTELLHSLAHEFGHAIGLEHNTNPASIMFPYNKSSMSLSPDDLAALEALCSK